MVKESGLRVSAFCSVSVGDTKKKDIDANFKKVVSRMDTSKSLTEALKKEMS